MPNDPVAAAAAANANAKYATLQTLATALASSAPTTPSRCR